MKLFEILRPTHHSRINFSRHPFGMGEADPDYFFGGWVETATGNMVNVFTNEDMLHHIQYIIAEPEVFGLTHKELGVKPEEWEQINTGDVQVGRWGEFEKIIQKVIRRGKWIRFYFVRDVGEMGFTATAHSMGAIMDNGILHALLKRFRPSTVVIDLPATHKHNKFAWPAEYDEMMMWIEKPR